MRHEEKFKTIIGEFSKRELVSFIKRAALDDDRLIHQLYETAGQYVPTNSESPIIGDAALFLANEPTAVETIIKDAESAYRDLLESNGVSTIDVMIQTNKFVTEMPSTPEASALKAQEMLNFTKDATRKRLEDKMRKQETTPNSFEEMKEEVDLFLEY